MNPFTHENQGSETVLVYHLSPEEHLDHVAKGMLQNNEMSGILRPVFTQRDLDQYLKYPITSKIPLKDYIQREMERSTVLKLCQTIAEAAQEIEDYMLSPKKLMLDTEYIYVDITKKEAWLIFLPIDEIECEVTLKEFFLHLLSHMCYQTEKDVSYVVKLINSLNQQNSWELQEWNLLIQDLLNEREAVQVQAAGLQNMESPLSGQDFSRPAQPPQDSVISAVPQPLPSQPEPPVQPPFTPPVIPQDSSEGEPKKKGLFGRREKKEKPSKKKSGKESADAGIVLPGMNIPGVSAPAVPGDKIPAPAGTPEIVLNIDPNGNYLPEQQPAEEKKKQTAEPVPPIQNPLPPQYSPQERNLRQFSAGSVPPQPDPRFSGYAGRNMESDDDRSTHTVILGGGDDYGSTVVLDSDSGTPARSRRVVRITRRRTRQSMTVNKDVFHIGREGTYADFYIGDNPSIGAIHADIFRDGSNYYISDRNTVNHTRVNGVLVAPGTPAPLHSGDIITLADEDFDFIIS